MDMRTEIVFVDSIKGNISRILIGEKSIPVEMPTGFMPDGTSEGDWLMMTFKQNRQLHAQNSGDVNNLVNLLGEKI